MVWFGCVQRMSLVYVCAEGEGFGDTFSRRHAERLDAAGGQHGWGVRTTWQRSIRTHARAAASNLLRYSVIR